MKIYVFDYDGVIVDSFEIVYKIIKKILKNFGIPKLNKKEFRELYDTNFFEAAAKKGFPIEKINEFLNQLQKELLLHENEIKMFKDIPEVLAKLSHIIIVTSNVTAVIKSYLDKHHVRYEDIIGSDKEISKIKKLEKIKTQNADAEIIFIGDTVGDIIEGKKAGVKTVAVTWGYQSKKKLMEAKPDYIFDNPAEFRKRQN